MYVQSAYNVVMPLAHEENGVAYSALFNTLAGTIDVIDEGVASALRTNGRNHGSFVSLEALSKQPLERELAPDVAGYLGRRGYLFGSLEEENRQSRLLYQEMIRVHREVAQQPLVVIPSYNCDLKCPYCWQRLYDMDSPIMSEEICNRLFESLDQFRDVSASQQVDLVVFGGEPLQDVPELRERVLQLLEMGRGHGFSTKIISNGVGLGPNVPHIRGKVDVIQITIDGPSDLHRRRRPLPNKDGQKQDSFTPMAEGVTRAVEAGIHINVRVNVDDVNLPRLPELADFAAEQGWLDSGLVKLHLAPVKNHNPRRETNSESDLLDKVLDLTRRDPRMSIFDLTGFPGIKYFRGFKETGLFSLHRFFNCEAQINFFAFDLHGDVYACWDAAGLKHLAVGRFYPEVEIDRTKLSQWRDRTSMDIDSCGGCTSSPHCGGGCQFLALEHNQTFQASNCDSMMEGYLQSISAEAEWLLARAKAGDHAVGLVKTDRVLTEVNRPFGIALENGPAELGIGCA